MTPKRIRSARAEDADAIAALYAASVTGSAVSFETTPPGPDEMRRRITTVQGTAPWLVCEADGAVCGYAYASRHRERAAYRWSLDSSVFVDRAHHREGVGRALYTALFALAKLQGYCAVHAGITLPNEASVGLHESLGFRKVAVYPAVGYKLGAWHDVGWWQLELRERREAPPELLSSAELEATHAEARAVAIALGNELLDLTNSFQRES